MRWIVGRSLRFRWLVVFAAAALMVFGIAQIPSTKVDVFPEFAPPRVEIQTIALGNSSNEVEELITVPIEDQLQGIAGLDTIRSKSVAQLSSIQLIFDRGTDELRARQLVQERLSQITSTLPSWAERLQQRHVQVDPARLARYGVPLERVMNVTADSLDAGLLQYSDGAVVGTGGFIETPGQRLNIRNVQPIVDPQQLGDVPLARRDGRTLRLADVGRVVEDHMPLWGDAVINDGPGLMLVVQKFRGANTMEVTRGVERAIDDLRPGLPGIAIDTTIFRPATFIEQSIDNLTTALWIGVLLVMLIIGAFLFQFRTAF